MTLVILPQEEVIRYDVRRLKGTEVHVPDYIVYMAIDRKLPLLIVHGEESMLIPCNEINEKVVRISEIVFKTKYPGQAVPEYKLVTFSWRKSDFDFKNDKGYKPYRPFQPKKKFRIF